MERDPCLSVSETGSSVIHEQMIGREAKWKVCAVILSTSRGQKQGPWVKVDKGALGLKLEFHSSKLFWHTAFSFSLAVFRLGRCLAVTT